MDRRALRWGGLALLLWLVYLVLQPFLIPLAWAAVLAIVSSPVHARLAVRWPAGRAAALTTAAVTVVLIVPGVWITIAFAREALGIATTAQDAIVNGRLAWVERAWSEFGVRFPPAANVDLAALGTDAVRQSVAFLVAQSGSIFQNVATFVVDLALALFATFFFLRDADDIMGAVRRLLPMDADDREALLARTRDLIWAGVISSAAVAALQGVLGGIAFAIVGIDAPLFWGVVMAFFCLLPFGAWVIWLPAALILWADGHLARALLLAGLGIGAVSAADNVVRPALLSGRVHMNGLVIFVGLLGGLSVFGLLGLVLGPVLVVTALGLLNGYLQQPASATSS